MIQHETDQSCTMFYSDRVRTSFWKIADTVYLLVITLPCQVCSHSPQVRAAGGYAACTLNVLSFRTFEKDYSEQNHAYIKEKDKEKHTWKPDDKWFYTNYYTRQIQNPKTIMSDSQGACGPIQGFVGPSLGFRCGITCLSYILVTCPRFDILNLTYFMQVPISGILSRLYCMLGNFHMPTVILVQNFLLVSWFLRLFLWRQTCLWIHTYGVVKGAK